MASPTDALVELPTARASAARQPSADAELGNRIWRVGLPGGRSVVLKLHRRRKSRARSLGRWLGTALLARKTAPDAASRCRTEERLLRSWREAGCDVPAVHDPADVGLAPGPALLLEDLQGDVLQDLLTRLPADERADVLRRLGAAWSARHRLALERSDPSLIMEHASLAHVMVVGGRLVTFDLEQGWRPGQRVLPLLAKELAASLRSLAKTVGEQDFPRDLADLVQGYGAPEQLGAIVQEGLAPGSPLRRIVAAWTRRRARRGFAYDSGAQLRAVQAALAS
jgi:hypothetical protein